MRICRNTPLSGPVHLNHRHGPGAINFFNLLPFWPLDGARCLAVLCNTFAPAMVSTVIYAMTGLAMAFAALSQSWILLAFLIFSLQSLQGAMMLSQVQRSMAPSAASGPPQPLATLATFGFVGWPLLMLIF